RLIAGPVVSEAGRVLERVGDRGAAAGVIVAKGGRIGEGIDGLDNAAGGVVTGLRGRAVDEGGFGKPADQVVFVRRDVGVAVGRRLAAVVGVVRDGLGGLIRVCRFHETRLGVVIVVSFAVERV